MAGLHPANHKLHEGSRPGPTHIEPSEHILADADEWQELASAQGPLPEVRPRRLHGPRVGGGGLSAGAGGGGGLGRSRAGARAGARRSPRSEDKVRYLPLRDSGTGHQAPGARRARPRARLRPGSGPRSDARRGLRRPLCSLTIVVDPGRLQELHCSAAAGLRREPRPSTRAGHGAAAASFSRAARPPAAARPAPSVPPRHRRLAPQAAATAAPRARPPPLPPQPHPLRRSSSGSSRATPEVTARTCQIAPAGNRSLRGRGRPGSCAAGRGSGGRLRFGSSPVAAMGEREGLLGPRRASGAASGSPGRRCRTGSECSVDRLSSSTSLVSSPTN